ncbi:MAG: carbohydrate kinase family protein [Dehalococcoidia bacterium]
MPESAVPSDPVLLVGAVTWDIVGGERRPGGAVTYAARVAGALGIRARVLVAAGTEADLDAFAGHELAVVRVEQTMTLEHRTVDGRRHQRVLARPDRPLAVTDLPEAWRHPRTIVLGTLLPGGIEAPDFLDLRAEECGVIAQGLQRVVAPDGAIAEATAPTDALLAVARPDVTLLLSDDDVTGWSAGDLEAVAARCRRFVRTRGARGAEIRDRDGVRRVEAVAAQPVDTTGAGDVFATALILAMRAGDDVAGRLAAACAAACVERPGSAPLPARAELITRAGLVPADLAPAGIGEGARGERP